MKIISNARIVLEDKIINGYVVIEGGKILRISEGKAPACQNVTDAGGNLLVPGFVDLHTHGAGGRDFMDGTVEDMVVAAQCELSYGTTTLLPTSLSSSDEDLFLFLDNFKALRTCGETLPNLPGVHLEGPYFDKDQKGAQASNYIKAPEASHYMKIIERAEGIVKRWSLAPELDGALKMLEDLKDESILFSAAHTSATYDDISKAFDHGLSLLTHFYSGMNSLTRVGGFRVLGTVESGYLIDGLDVELISDGLHLPPDLLRLIFKCKDNKHIISCTDSMRGAGMPEGPSILGPKKNGQEVIIEDGIAKMPDRTCFAGSVATGDRMFRTLVSIAKLEPWQAAYCVSLHPAELIGLGDVIGSIKSGKRADIVLLDSTYHVSRVFLAGEEFIL